MTVEVVIQNMHKKYIPNKKTLQIRTGTAADLLKRVGTMARDGGEDGGEDSYKLVGAAV